MHWHIRAAIGAAGAALLLPAAIAGASVAALDEEQLRDALLDHMDFPAEWAGDTEESAAERGIGVPQPQERSCQTLFDHTAQVTARAGFARTHTGPFVVTTAAAHRDTEQARQAVADFRSAAEDCASFHSQEGEGDAALTVVYRVDEAEPVTADGLGEDFATVRFHRERESPDAPPVIADAVLVRVGEHTVLVAQAGRDDSGTGSLEPLAARAVEKLRAVAEGRTPAPETEQPGTEL
jgi:hypothetical protein